jgi:spore coat protein A
MTSSSTRSPGSATDTRGRAGRRWQQASLGGLALAGLLLASPALAATVTLSPSQDNTIYQGVDPGSTENFEDNSCGSGPGFFTGVTVDGFSRRALIQFDIAGAIPAGSTIDRVELALSVDRTGDGQGNTRIVELHPVTRDWGEGAVDCSAVRGGGQGLDAEPGDATWLDAMFQQVAWTSSGGDFGTPSGSTAVGTRGDVPVWDSAVAGNEALVTDVQSWLDAPGANSGWILVHQDEGTPSTTRRYSSREGSAPPQLAVDFTPVGDVFACCFDSGDCTIADTTSCTDQGGTPDTTVNSCEPNPCPQPVGACCNVDESCSDDVDRVVCEDAGGIFQGAGSTCSQGSIDCGLAPFVDPLPIPAVVQPVATRADGVPQYEITMTQERQILHSELPASDVWTYNGTYPGPTIEATVGQPIEVKYVNSLPSGNQKRGRHLLEVDECAHGPSYWQDTARTVVHLHGGHVPARVDGQPEYDFMPGGFDVYEYPNAQLPATLWYHDHALGTTRLNVYAGMAAFYLLRDAFEQGLGLPSGEFEIPLVIQDREFNSDGTLFYNPTLQDAFKGDKIVVNGKVWPFLNVKQGKYRFRLLNGSQSREYSLRLENAVDPAQVIPFQLIGTDGGLIDAPIPLDTIPTMAPAERLDVVVDFAEFETGTELILRNDKLEVPNVPNVMKFVVTAEPGFTEPLPTTLRPVPPLDPAGVPTRYFRLTKLDAACVNDPNRIVGEWLIESLDGPGGAVFGEHWDDLTDFPVLGTREIWEFENPTNSMHPMHVHLVMFQVLDKESLDTGQPIPLEAWEQTTWKDTVRVPPRSKVRVVMDFEDYLGRFPFHCHILDHEDHEMMRQFQTTNDPAGCVVNGTCDPGEDCQSCPADCGQVSGAFCGNGLCEIDDGEDCQICAADCAGKANGKSPFCCGLDVTCDVADPAYDPRCTDGYFCRVARRVLACCGDSLCEGQEDEVACALDCAAAPEDCSQIQDKDTCNAAPSCEWKGGPRSGSCLPVDGGACTSEGPVGDPTCGDGLDNDCDGLVDGDDADCQQVVDCSQFPDRSSCKGQPGCTWDNKNKVCTPG